MNHSQLKIAVRKIVNRQAKEPFYELIQYTPSKGNVITLQQDDFHFVVNSKRILLQISIRVHESGVMTTIFASPQVVTRSTRPAFIEFVNELNL